MSEHRRNARRARRSAFTLKDRSARPWCSYARRHSPAEVDRHGPITNHVNFGRTRNGPLLRDHRRMKRGQGISHRRRRAGRTDFGRQAAARHLAVGDGSRIYVGLENADGMAAIDTPPNKWIATSPTAAPQAIHLCSERPPRCRKETGTQAAPLDVAGPSPPPPPQEATHLAIGAVEGRKDYVVPAVVRSEDKGRPVSRCSTQGMIQVLQGRR